METVILAIVLCLLAWFAWGNFLLILALFSGWDVLSGEGSSVAFAIIMDIILLYLVLNENSSNIKSSYQLMKNGLKNRRITKRGAIELKELMESEEVYVNRFEELRSKKIREDDVKRTLHICQLIESIAGGEQLEECLSKVKESQSILDEMDDIRNRILKTVENCKNFNDFKKCYYYLDILKSAKITPEIASLEEECLEQNLLREKEKGAIRLWALVFGLILAVLAGGFVLFLWRLEK